MFRFEGLEVWKEAVSLYKDIALLTKKFQRAPNFAIINQLNRSSLSISLNIAEGSGRDGKKEFKLFLSYAKGSLFETVSNLKICQELGLIEKSEYKKLYIKSEKLGKMLSSFSKVLVNR